MTHQAPENNSHDAPQQPKVEIIILHVTTIDELPQQFTQLVDSNCYNLLKQAINKNPEQGLELATGLINRKHLQQQAWQQATEQAEQRYGLKLKLAELPASQIAQKYFQVNYGNHLRLAIEYLVDTYPQLGICHHPVISTVSEFDNYYALNQSLKIIHIKAIKQIAQHLSKRTHFLNLQQFTAELNAEIYQSKPDSFPVFSPVMFYGILTAGK
jgi:hypothetical protein